MSDGALTNRSSKHAPFFRSATRNGIAGPPGPYLVESRPDATLLGGTGLTFETPERAMTGYILARDAWGNGYATEALQAMIDTARTVGVQQLYALCHIEHQPSWHVLEKCGFTRESDSDPLRGVPEPASGESVRCVPLHARPLSPGVHRLVE